MSGRQTLVLSSEANVEMHKDHRLNIVSASASQRDGVYGGHYGDAVRDKLQELFAGVDRVVGVFYPHDIKQPDGIECVDYYRSLFRELGIPFEPLHTLSSGLPRDDLDNIGNAEGLFLSGGEGVRYLNQVFSNHPFNYGFKLYLALALLNGKPTFTVSAGTAILGQGLVYPNFAPEDPDELKVDTFEHFSTFNILKGLISTHHTAYVDSPPTRNKYLAELFNRTPVERILGLPDDCTVHFHGPAFQPDLELVSGSQPIVITPDAMEGYQPRSTEQGKIILPEGFYNTDAKDRELGRVSARGWIEVSSG